MKKLRILGPALLGLSLLAEGINVFWMPLPDWAVRLAGLVLLAALAATGYSAGKRRAEKG